MTAVIRWRWPGVPARIHGPRLPCSATLDCRHKGGRQARRPGGRPARRTGCVSAVQVGWRRLYDRSILVDASQVTRTPLVWIAPSSLLAAVMAGRYSRFLQRNGRLSLQPAVDFKSSSSPAAERQRLRPPSPKILSATASAWNPRGGLTTT